MISGVNIGTLGFHLVQNFKHSFIPSSHHQFKLLWHVCNKKLADLLFLKTKLETVRSSILFLSTYKKFGTVPSVLFPTEEKQEICTKKSMILSGSMDLKSSKVQRFFAHILTICLSLAFAAAFLASSSVLFLAKDFCNSSTCSTVSLIFCRPTLRWSCCSSRSERFSWYSFTY